MRLSTQENQPGTSFSYVCEWQGQDLVSKDAIFPFPRGENEKTCFKFEKVKVYRKLLVKNTNLPATVGSRSASSAEAAAQETLGKRYIPASFESSHLLTSGNENRLTTFIASPTI